MELPLKINSTSGSKWRPFLKIIITRKKLLFFGGSISTSVNYIKRPLRAKFHAFNQKCTIFSHNRLTKKFGEKSARNGKISQNESYRHCKH